VSGSPPTLKLALAEPNARSIAFRAINPASDLKSDVASAPAV